MPDLNLQDDEGTIQNPEGSGESYGEMTETAPSGEEGQEERKGGMLKILIIIAGILILGGGTVFLLNSLGIIKLWGGAPQTTVMQYEEPAAAESPSAETTPAEQPSQEKMVETPALDEGKPAKAAETKTPASSVAKIQQPAKPMPSPATGGKLNEMQGEYTVQVSAWREEGTARELVHRLEEAGYPAFVESRPYTDGNWYTVRIGRYPSRKEAQLAVANFAEELQSNHWIDRVRNK